MTTNEKVREALEAVEAERANRKHFNNCKACREAILYAPCGAPFVDAARTAMDAALSESAPPEATLTECVLADCEGPDGRIPPHPHHPPEVAPSGPCNLPEPCELHPRVMPAPTESAPSGVCGCGNAACRGPADNEHHQCGGPREACGVAGCRECPPPAPVAQTREAESLPCGHPASLALRSIESATVLCELCEAKDAAQDAEEMERTLRAELESAKEREVGDCRELDALRVSAESWRIGGFTSEGHRDHMARLGRAAKEALGLDGDNDAPSDLTEQIATLRAELEAARGQVADLRIELDAAKATEAGVRKTATVQMARADAAEKRAEEAGMLIRRFRAMPQRHGELATAEWTAEIGRIEQAMDAFLSAEKGGA